MDIQHFTVIVAGDDPMSLMEKYDSRTKTERHIVFKFSDAKKIFDGHLKVLRELIKRKNISDNLREAAEIELEESIDAGYLEFYSTLTEKCEIDEETGDAYSEDNENAKFDAYNEPKLFAVPFVTMDGKETFHAVKSDINWEKIHLANRKPYEVAWDCVMEGKIPADKYETDIYENMKNREEYFMAYGDRENYIASNTAFWAYAFLSEETGWQELKRNADQFEWVVSYYDKFIKNLDENTMLSIYECIITNLETCRNY